MKYRKMELMLCEDFAVEVSDVHAQQLCIAAANGVIRAPVVVHQQSKPDLTEEEEELLSFLSNESFSFDAMQSRWQ